MIRITKISMLRTVDGCLEFIKRYDPDSIVSSFYIRELIRNGEIKCKKSGNKIYINLIDLLEFLGFEIEHEVVPCVEETLLLMDQEKNKVAL